MEKFACPKASTDAEQLAVEHVEWFLEVIKPLLITHFIHGYRHGEENTKKEIE